VNDGTPEPEKLALTLRDWFSTTLQADVPLHAPVQPVNVFP
jgi:hypothetical protein